MSRTHSLAACLAAGIFCSCVFETLAPPVPGPGDRDPDAVPEIRPDLSIGNQWMYLSVQYTERQDGSKSDSVRYFIRYEIIGDSVIANMHYRIMIEEDLIMFNTDYGLVKTRSVYAIRTDTAALYAKALLGESGAIDHLPFKASAQKILDTTHFQDEVTSMVSPLFAGKAWTYREAGNKYGIAPAVKTCLGPDTLPLGGKSVPAFKFQLQVEGLEHIRMYEWYAEDVKIFSRYSSSTTYEGRDSSRWEETYLGKRTFRRDDTLEVLRGTIFDPEAD